MSSTDRRLCAIHQPNFFPWLGYFDKISRSDVFVFFDDVQLQKTRGGWANRVQLLVGGQARWISAPLDRAYHGVKPICEVRFSANEPHWRESLRKTVLAQYSKAKYFKSVQPWLDPLIMNQEVSLSEYNITAINEICNRIGLKCNAIKSSSLITQGNSTDLLISTVIAAGANAYLCGGGASGYQEDEKFGIRGLDLEYQNFAHPRYQQFKGDDFLPGLSIIDALMHCGVAGVREILRISV
ncbi:WbqC family protein [Achromobacter veterisilvae]|uniref:WbqC family protein n=1 Tax=Achromobacter veterisilvae TaxID=2069367 RepID=A0ABZ2S3P5_9BURK